MIFLFSLKDFFIRLKKEIKTFKDALDVARLRNA